MIKRIAIFPLHHFEVSYSRPLPNKISISKQVSIIKLTEGFEKDAFDEYGDVYSSYDKQQILSCSYAIKIHVDEIDNEQEIENIKNRVLAGIRLTKPSALCSSGLYQKQNGRKVTTYRRVRSSYQDSLYPSGYKPKDLIFLSTDTNTLRKNIRFVLDLYDQYAGKYHKVLNAIIFFEDSYKNRLYKPRFILLVSALESLFNSSTSQIRYTFRERISLFLRNKYDERMEIHRLAGEIYDTRSSFVHGGSADKKLVKNKQRSSLLLMSLDSLCRQSINKIAKENLLNVFNDNNSVNEYFNKLIFK